LIDNSFQQVNGTAADSHGTNPTKSRAIRWLWSTAMYCAKGL
jgi:hypothetical protein